LWIYLTLLCIIFGIALLGSIANTRIAQFQITFIFVTMNTMPIRVLKLVAKNIKQATAPSVWWYEYHNEPMPKVGTLFIVTDWHGDAKAIIEVTKLEQIRFKDVGEAFAYAEGEGDRSLAYWRKVHRAYYTREMKKAGTHFNENMLILCAYFKLIFS
jgi:uncharacterized protein YhfF